MNDGFQAGMLEAARLTREGRLVEATALVQSLLDAGPISGAASTGTSVDGPRLELKADGGAQEAHSSALPFSAMRAGTALRNALRTAGERIRSKAFGTGMQGAERSAPADPAIPDGARFITDSYQNQSGRRSYKLYVPGNRSRTRLPLVVMLHGCTQSPDDFAAGTQMNARAEEQGFFVAYPAQPRSANASRCWNWFSPGDQQRGHGEPSLIAGITRQVIQSHQVDHRRVFIAGLSAGGAAAAIMGAAYPELYAAAGIHSGLACGCARDVPSAFAAMRGGGSGRRRASHGAVPTIVFHGDQDTTVAPRNGEQVIAQVANAMAGGRLQMRTERGQVDGGHAYTRTLHSDAQGRAVLEHWLIHGAGHAWAGGNERGSFTDPKGPDATREMLRFFADHPQSISTPRSAA